MIKLNPIPYGSLFFAPMEGITDHVYRQAILDLYPEWDYLSCDFLRVPSAGKYPLKHLVRHLGESFFEIPWIKEKTLFQILTSHRAFTQEMVLQMSDLGVPWLDLNLGCPSQTVCKNGGGSFLLKDLVSLRPLIQTIRKNFQGRFTAKIRAGYHDAASMEHIIQLLCDEGVEYITVHGRTKEQMYREPANWDLIKRAVEVSTVPIIGNGDIWETSDIDRMLKYTECHAVMVARGALKAPWMAQDYRKQFDSNRVVRMNEFLTHYRQLLESEKISMRGLLKQSKSICRFMTDGMIDGEMIRRKLMLSQTVPEFYSVIDQLKLEMSH